MVSGIGRVIEIKECSFTTDSGREFELPFDLDGVTADTLDEWLDYFAGQLGERQEDTQC